MADTKWRQDANDYMDDAQYQEYMKKKSDYAKNNPINPEVSKLAQMYKKNIPGSTDPNQIVKNPDQLLPLGSGEVGAAQQSVRDATGYADGGEVSPEDFEDTLRTLRQQGTRVKDMRGDLNISEDDIQPSPKRDALRKFLKK